MSGTLPHHEAKQSSVELKLSEEHKRMEIKPVDLSIIWGKDSRYWNVPDDGRPAELYQVSWFEVTGCVSKTEPEKEYEVGFNISLMPDAFGRSGSPVYILVKRGKASKFKGQKLTLDSPKVEEDIKATVTKLDNEKTDDEDEKSKVYFGLYEVWRGKWKEGLKIHYAFIQEKN